MAALPSRRRPLTLQDPPLHLEGLRLAGPLPPQPERALDLAGRLTHAAAVPLLPPIDFAGTLEPANGGYEIAATRHRPGRAGHRRRPRHARPGGAPACAPA